VCIESKLLKLKVPIVFLGAVGFSLNRDGRYIRRYTIAALGWETTSLSSVEARET
jgi:hypothetical protein